MWGVLQGSVLGHSLFLLHINDLPATMDSLTLFFADNTSTFIRSVRDLEGCTAERISMLQTWLLENGLKS